MYKLFFSLLFFCSYFEFFYRHASFSIAMLWFGSHFSCLQCRKLFKELLGVIVYLHNKIDGLVLIPIRSRNEILPDENALNTEIISEQFLTNTYKSWLSHE